MDKLDQLCEIERSVSALNSEVSERGVSCEKNFIDDLMTNL